MPLEETLDAERSQPEGIASEGPLALPEKESLLPPLAEAVSEPVSCQSTPLKLASVWKL